MIYSTILVRKLTPIIGAEIAGLDLAKPLSNLQCEEINRALTENIVLFFRNQRITVAELKAFARLFGPLHVHPLVGREDDPEIIELKADENSTSVNGEFWHCDCTWDREPPMGTVLQLLEAPENGGGDTLFANMYVAYETLSEPVQQMLDGLSANHDMRYGIASQRRHRDMRRDRKDGRTDLSAVHPVVRTHPVTGRKALFVNRFFTSDITGLSPIESRAILDMLFLHMEQDFLKCRFKWDPYSIAFWDNRVATHSAIWDYHGQKRFGLRATIVGTRPI